MPEKSKLRVFLCHSSQDKPAVRELYARLKAEDWIDPWLDEEELYPGQDWDMEIEKAVEAADAVIVFISNNSVTKEGYVQRELRFVLRIADFKPEDIIFVIPVRLGECPIPRRFSMWQYLDYFPIDRKEQAYQRLLSSLEMRAPKEAVSTNKVEKQASHGASFMTEEEKLEQFTNDIFDVYTTFIKRHANKLFYMPVSMMKNDLNQKYNSEQFDELLRKTIRKYPKTINVRNSYSFFGHTRYVISIDERVFSS